MSGDLDGQDAFDKLLEVALESRVDVRRAQDERDAARLGQREAERLAAERQSKIGEFERNERTSLPLLRELWEAANAALGSVADNEDRARLHKAIEAASVHCDQPPF